jgi:ElaB/YqjD/DUF883 family membrane-anchored ribosome-binding protein
MEVQMDESHQPTDPGYAGLSRPDNSSTAKSDDNDHERANGARVLSDLKDKVAGAQEVVRTKYRAVSESTEDFVHDSPWKAVTMAVIGGLIIGMLAAR